MNVVAIDDEPGILFVLSKLFTKMGWKILTFDDEYKALDFIYTTNDKIDMILLDFDLRHTTGVEIFKKIREKNPKQPIIIISGRHDPQQIDYLNKEGLNGFVQKPFVFAELRESISKVLSIPT
jgi:DNA-binding NtrC family response regulator